MRNIKNSGLIFAAALLLISCGGGGGGGSSSASAPTSAVSGVAADSKGAIANATVTVKDTAGQSATGTTSNNGNYSVNVQGMTPPFLVNVTSNGVSWYGYAAQEGRTANVTPISTKILEAYYLGTNSTVAQTFQGKLASANVPTINQIAALTRPVVKALQPVLVAAGVSNPQTFNPLSTPFTFSRTTGFGLMLVTTSILSNGIGFKVTSPTAQALNPTASVSFSSGSPTAPVSIPSNDLVTVNAAATDATGASTMQSKVVDLCRAHGTVIPRASGGYDCTSKITIAPATINISAGAWVALDAFQFMPSNLNPSIDTTDSNGYDTSVPLANLAWAIGDPTVIDFLPFLPGTFYWPGIEALKVGSSTVSITDTITGAAAKVTVNGVIPILTPSVMAVSCTAYGGFPCTGGRATLTHNGERVAVPPYLSVATTDPNIATATYDGRGIINVTAVRTGITTLAVTGKFGQAGMQTINSTICVQTFAPTTITGSYTATEMRNWTGPDSGTFSGTLTNANIPTCTGLSWYISDATMKSSLYGGYYSVADFSAVPPMIPAPNFGMVQPSLTVMGVTSAATAIIGFQQTGTIPGTFGVDVGACSVSNWTTGPMAGLSGASSTGTGTWHSNYTVSGLGTFYSYSGTCTVTVQ